MNLQPVAHAMALDVYRGGERFDAGRTWECEDKREDMRASLRELDAAVAAGLFAPRKSIDWQLRMRYDTAEDWQEFLDRPVAGPFDADLEAIDAALAEPADWVRSTEDDVATLYDRV